MWRLWGFEWHPNDWNPVVSMGIFLELHNHLNWFVITDATQDGCGGNLRLEPWSGRITKPIQIYASLLFKNNQKGGIYQILSDFLVTWPFIQRTPSFLTNLDKLLRNKCVKLCWIPVHPFTGMSMNGFVEAPKLFDLWFIWGLETVTTPPTPVVPTIVARTCNGKPLMLLVDE